MRPSLFKLSIGLMVVGIVWLSVIFFEGNRVSESFVIKPSDSIETQMNFAGNDIGYYKIFMPDFAGTGVFVQILDEKYNVMADGVVETKMSVGYFDHEKSGKYVAKISNTSKKPIRIDVEFGETNSSQMTVPGIITLGGGLMLVYITYIKLRNYRMAQPDENIS